MIIGLILPTIYCLVVVLVVPFCIVININKKKRENSNRNNGQNTSNTYSHSGYVPGNTYLAGNTQRNVPGNTYVAGNAQVQRSIETWKHHGHVAGRNVPGNGQSSMQGNVSGNASGNTQRNTSGNTAEKKSQTRQSGSTREYLEKKAMEDQREHVAEKMEEQRRVSAKYGNMPIAGRHILGDPVPSGMRLVCCKYCGAENEVKMGYRSGLACYFCRTEL